ncbi:hypothetical protein OG21DRAFT_1515967 [Imleria badia]|nr:hypothetical protein OG21DRAFT_1515967 [Imleria badia]
MLWKEVSAQNEPSDESTSLASAAKLPWKCGYRGNYHEAMLQNINAMERTPYRANSVPLIQSSGYGKSRMADEQAKLVFFNSVQYSSSGRMSA